MLHIVKFMFFSVFAVIGSGLSVHSIVAMFSAYESNEWPSVTGQVLEARCTIATSRPATSAKHVKYAYAVGPSTYVGEREHFGIRIANNNCIAGYKDNQTVTIFYDPDDPSLSVLQPGLYKPALFGLVVGIVFTVFGVGGYLYDRKKRT